MKLRNLKYAKKCRHKPARNQVGDFLVSIQLMRFAVRKACQLHAAKA